MPLEAARLLASRLALPEFELIRRSELFPENPHPTRGKL